MQDEGDANHPEYRVRIVSQAELANEGTTEDDRYVGSKWGRYLRSTDTLFSLQKAHRDAFVPLRQLAAVKRGLTTNCDDFFIVSDVSDGALRGFDSGAFRSNFGVRRSLVESGEVRIIRRSDGYQQPLESRYLRAILKTARDVEWFATSRIGSSHFAVMLDGNLSDLSEFARRYVAAGEREDWHRSPSFEAIQDNGGNWYSLRGTVVAPVLFIKTMQYTPVVLWNDADLVVNQRLYTVEPVTDVSPLALCAVLNSTVFACERYAAVKALGREAAIDVEVFTANAFRTPDITGIHASEVGTLEGAMSELAQRRVAPMVEEPLLQLGLTAARAYVHRNPVSPDVWPEEIRNTSRLAIDALVLELLGIPQSRIESTRREMCNELVAHTRRLRILELEAQLNRQGQARISAASPAALADDLWASLIESGGPQPRVIPDDFLNLSDEAKEITVPNAGRLHASTTGLFEEGNSLTGRIGRTSMRFDSPEEMDLVGLLAQYGLTGRISVPVRRERCGAVLQEIRTYLDALSHSFTECVNELTSDQEMRRRIMREAWRKLRKSL
jgi:hypothetical protein